MGRGDIKTKKGKIKAGSFGKSRPATKPKKASAPKAKPEAEAEATPVKKAARKKTA